MVKKLERENYFKVRSLIKNTTHELSIEAVIVGNSPGEIFVDNTESPKSALIYSPECNLVAGDANNDLFNKGIREKIDNYEQITCDTEDWEYKINEIHPNITVKKYIRRYFEFDKPKFNDFADNLDKEYEIEYVYADNLPDINYENSDIIKEWLKFNDINQFNDYCLGAYIIKDNVIVSCCIVDCIVGDKIEIGIKTDKNYRKKGLAAIVVAAAIKKFLSLGVNDIGWHCVDTNIGSIKTAEKVGFKKIKEYYSFTPFPPVENVTDISKDEWAKWAEYYEEFSKEDEEYCWLASSCYAKAFNIYKAIHNLNSLLECEQTWFLNLLATTEEFTPFSKEKAWIDFIEKAENHPSRVK